jgi:hypothetical protein
MDPLEVFILRFVAIMLWMIAIAFQEVRINWIREENKRLKIETPEFIKNARMLQLFLELFLIQEIAWMLIQNAGGTVPSMIELGFRTIAAGIMVFFLIPKKKPLLKSF